MFILQVQFAARGQWERGDEWRAAYKVGDQVQFTVSGNEADFQTCTVSTNDPGFPMRVACKAFKQWGAGSYIVYGKSSLRPLKNTETKKEPINKASNRPPAEQPSTQKKWGYGDEWRGEFAVGDKIQFSISGKAADFQTCRVAENNPEAVLRVRCDAFKQWDAGTYIVHAPSYIRAKNTTTQTKEPEPTNEDNRNRKAVTPAPAKPTAPPPAGLKVGEYACYGVGGRIMIGLGFKVLPGNRYTDLDGHNPGSFSITGNTVSFRGGHLGGKTGRNLRGHSFTIGAQAECEPY